MIWLAPWALLGLAAVTVPVLVHWLARHQATRLRFPSIQFLVRSSPVSVRRYRVKDVPLLLVRMAIIAAAALALAQPVWVRPGAPAAQPARAVVLDTSASLQRLMADGRVGADVARETAASVLAGSGSSASTGAPAVSIATEQLAEGVAQAAAWLATQTAPRELVVVSDFQVGALVESDLDTVPEDADVRLLPIAVSGPVPAVPAPARGRLRVLAGREDAALAAASEAAARAVSGQMSSEAISSEIASELTLVFPSAPNAAELRRSSQPIDTPELFTLVREIRRELRVFGSDTAGPELGGGFKKTASELMVFSDARPGTTEAAALMTAILRAIAPPALVVAEREPDTLSPSALESWQRQVTPGPILGRPGDSSDGRWFWALALALFVVEHFMRRPAVDARPEVLHADAA
jgi:hypothetical protein